MENSELINLPKIKVGITHGDINGIGYEVILKSFKDSRLLEFFTPVIYGSPKVAAYYKKVLKISQIQLNHIKHIDKADPNAINIINCVDNKVRVELGRATEISGKAALDALKAAIADLKEGKLDAIITAPINKKAVYGENFDFKGHTWFLANEFGVKDVLMLMVHHDLRIAAATDHIALSQVSSVLTKELIENKVKILDTTLINDFKIDKPKIAVLSLNPHSGDDGIIGTEEKDVIIPAIEDLKRQGYIVLGPYPADGFFASGNYKNFDAVLGMYHDQAMLPFKLLSLGQGVNYTANLPIIRTSPAHGTAYDIAGLNKADAKSFINALFLAREIYKNRSLFKDIKPLEKQNMEELLPTLMPAKAAELQEMEAIQREDEEDNILSSQKPEVDSHSVQPQKKEEKTLQRDNNIEKQQKVNEMKSQEDSEKSVDNEVITVDHPDVEIETVDEPEQEKEEHLKNQTQKLPPFNKLKERLHNKGKQHNQRKPINKPNPKDYRDLT